MGGRAHPQLDESVSTYSGALGETRRYVSGYAAPRLRPDHLARCRPIEIGSNSVDWLGLDTYVFSSDLPGGNKHLFIGIKDDETGEVTTYGLYPSSRKDAINTIIGSRLGGNPSTTSDVYKNDSRELPAAKAFFNNKPLPDGHNVELMVKVPKGMTEKEFEELLRKNSENYPTDERPYNAWNGPNSNTFIDDLLEKSGAQLPDIEGARAQNWGEPGKDKEVK